MHTVSQHHDSAGSEELKFPREIPDISPDGLIEKLLQRKWYDDNLVLALACYHEAHRSCLGCALILDLKMSLRCRGGYCFESNGLLAEALVGLGFEVYCVAGRNLIESLHCKSKLQVRLCRASHGKLACMLIQWTRLRKELWTLAWLSDTKSQHIPHSLRSCTWYF